jgi:hypothetical protein
LPTPANEATAPVGRAIEPFRVVAEQLGRLATVIEMELPLRVVGHVLIHPDDLVLQDGFQRLLCCEAMAVIMLSFMLGMYSDTKKNVLIYVVSAVVFFGALYLVRSQQTIGDVAYMKAMIPHHSIAVMTSERAHIRDPRTRELAKQIIDAQRREIAEMKYLVSQIEEYGVKESAGREVTP